MIEWKTCRYDELSIDELYEILRLNIIHAQAYLKRFYEPHGFRQSSDICIIDGIDHIEMTLS